MGLVGALSLGAAAPAAAAETFVNIQAASFNPRAVTIAAGDTVVWQNADSQSHTVTFDDGYDSHPECVRGLLGSVGCMEPGDEVRRTFTQPGVFSYRCKIHASMTGTVTVPEPATTTTLPPTTVPPTTTTTRAPTTTTTRPLATSSTVASSTTTTMPAETTTTVEPNEAPAFDPDNPDGPPSGEASPASTEGDGSDSGTLALIVALLLAVAGGGGVLLWRLRPSRAIPD